MSAAEFFTSKGFGYTFYTVCLLCAVILFSVTVARLFFVGTKNERFEYLKNYKKGQFALIYVIAIPLYFIGFLHVRAATTGMNIFECFLSAIDAAFDLLKLGFGMDKLSPYMSVDKYFTAAVMVCYIVTLFNVVFFTASFLFQRLKNFFGKVRARLSNDLVIVIGNNENNIVMLESLRGNGKRRGMLFAGPTPSERDELYIKNIVYSNFRCDTAFENELEKKVMRAFGFRYRHGLAMRKNVTVVINTGDDTLNLLYTENILRIMKGNVKSSDSGVTALLDVPVDARHACVTVYAFCKPFNRTAFREYAEQSRGHINLMDSYERCALDFVYKYPLTAFMSDAQIDCGTGTVKDVPINVCLVGFGGINRELFSKLVADSQFYTKNGDTLVHKKVNYHAFDKNEAYLDKNLNQTYFRYSLEFFATRVKGKSKAESEKEFLPMPDYPAADWCDPLENPNHPNENGFFHKIDINSYRFYECLRNVIDVGASAFSYIIVAFGDDLENIDLAKKILSRLDMWGISGGTHVFARVSDERLAAMYSDEKFHIFGTRASVYDLNKIAADPVRNMAFYKSFSYARTDCADPAMRRALAVKKWMGSGLEQKNSNYYCVLGLRTKLNLLGFDYAPVSSAVPDAGTEFLDAYYGTHDMTEIDSRLRGRCDVTVYEGDSVRTNLAVQEHQRWNAFYICSGVIPSDIESIRAGCGKDMTELLVHCNLTTFDGLKKYAEIVNPSDPDKADVRNYDYRILDYADRLLFDAGYKIIKSGLRTDSQI